MRRGDLQRGSERKRAAFVAGERIDAGDFGVPARQRSGFIEDDGIDACKPLERVGILHEYAVPRCDADAGDDRGRRCEAERAGASDD